MSKGDAALLRQLASLTKDLTFMSESDYPVAPFTESAKGRPAFAAQDAVAALKAEPNATVSEVALDNFFNGVTNEYDGQSAEAQQTARRFQALVKFLKDNLTDIKVYRVGDTEADVYVVGKTPTGNFAGVTTKVVET